MIHVIGSNLTIEKVRAVPLIDPPSRPGSPVGARWVGLKHGDLVDAVLAECKVRGWKVTDRKFALSNDLYDMAAAFSLTVPDLAVPGGQILGLGVLTSNARRRALKLVVGSTVKVCSNGMCTGDILIDRLHTVGMDVIKDELKAAMDEYLIKAALIREITEGYMASEMTDQEVSHVLIQAASATLRTRTNVLPVTSIPDVWREWKEPRFKEFEPRTAWSLLNAFTYVVKRTPPLLQMDRIEQFRNLLPVPQEVTV